MASRGSGRVSGWQPYIAYQGAGMYMSDLPPHDGRELRQQESLTAIHNMSHPLALKYATSPVDQQYCVQNAVGR